MSLKDLQKEIKSLADPVRAKNLAWYFKTGKGEYGEGDIFIGLTVPTCRMVAGKYLDLSLADLTPLIQSPRHEERLICLEILVAKMKKADSKEQKKIVGFYLKYKRFANNWDLVDASAYDILGTYLLDKSLAPLTKLAQSKSLWDRRIAIVATYQFIRHNRFEPTLQMSALLLADKHDLIHKAIGWMLREVGKRSLKTETDFLKKHYRIMPRTTLRYAIERFPENTRQAYLKGKI